MHCKEMTEKRQIKRMQQKWLTAQRFPENPIKTKQFCPRFTIISPL